jgi:polygalacturonase
MSADRRDFLKIASLGAAVAGFTAPWARAQSPETAPGVESATYDVRSFGAVGDGKAIDTPAVNRAIEAAAAAGGGTVCFPAGTYACYSIHLRSNVALQLGPGATILAADTPMEGTTIGGYDAAEPNSGDNHYQDYGHSHWHNSLIWGEDLHDFAIFGQGLIWGRGLSRGFGKDTPPAETPGVGNKSIALKNCRNVLLRDFSILKGGHFGILATGADNLTIDNVLIDTNRDGMDLDCCRNARVSNCTVDSPWDDAICPKSSFALNEPRVTENLTISNCCVSGSYEIGSVLDGSFKKFSVGVRVPWTGRIKFGTESNGGFRNITVSNCVFDGCGGIALESVDGADLEEVTFTGITMRDISNAPIFLRLGRRMRGPEGRPIGKLHRLMVSDIVCYNSASRICSILSGIPDHSIEDLKISDIYLHHQGGGTKEMAAIQPPELETSYPEPTMFGPMPTHGFFVRHVKNIEFSNVEIACDKPDARPAFLLDAVQGADFFRTKTPTGSGPVFSLRDVSDFRALACRGVKDTQLAQVKQKEL